MPLFLKFKALNYSQIKLFSVKENFINLPIISKKAFLA